MGIGPDKHVAKMISPAHNGTHLARKWRGRH